MERPKTIICDIDGCIFPHGGDICRQHLRYDNPLPGVLEQFRAWDLKGYKIILLTGRRESTRKETEEQLSKHGIFYDTLVMGASGGERVLINDRKPNKSNDTAFAINVDRNEGLENVQI